MVQFKFKFKKTSLSVKILTPSQPRRRSLKQYTSWGFPPNRDDRAKPQNCQNRSHFEMSPGPRCSWQSELRHETALNIAEGSLSLSILAGDAPDRYTKVHPLSWTTQGPFGCSGPTQRSNPPARGTEPSRRRLPETVDGGTATVADAISRSRLDPCVARVCHVTTSPPPLLHRVLPAPPDARPC